MRGLDVANDARSIPLLSARRLISGRGEYVANHPASGCLHAVFVRSDVAHARISSIDCGTASAEPGVAGVYGYRDLDRLGMGRIPVGWILPGQHASENDVLARDVVRYVGEPLAVVVAESAAAAEDAASLVEVAYERLPAVVDAEQALAADAPILHDDWGENVLARTSVDAGDCDGAFSSAAVVVTERFRLARTSCAPMETCGAIATYDGFRDQLTLLSSTQSPHHVRSELAACLGRPEGSIRVIAADVGGSFGAKDHACAEEAVLALLALRTGRPVRWIEERRDHLAATGHSREQILDLELACDAEGRVLGLRGRLLLDVGAYSSTHGMGTAVYTMSLLPGPYRLANYRLEAIGVMTNKAPTGAYRGYGAPEAAFAIEGLVDRAARAVGLDPVEMRRRNLIGSGEFPFETASGLSYDGCDLHRLLDSAVSESGYEDHLASVPSGTSPSGTELDGYGIACCVLMGGFGPSEPALAAGMSYGGYDSAAVRMGGDGKATLFTGMPTQGQGLDTTLAQICASSLGLSAERDVTVVAGDTTVTPYSPVGPIASRGIAVGGSAVHRASEKVGETLRLAAAEMMEASPADLVLADGLIAVRGVPSRSLPIASVARAVKEGRYQSRGIEPTLEAVATFEPPDLTYSFAVHVARVRVDAATGRVRVTGYWVAADCGVLVNPGVVEGQMIGGVVQGLGEALTEALTYDPEGQLLTSTFLDYGLLSAPEVPMVEVALFETPTSRTPTGARGAGELGIIGPVAAVANAVADALGAGAGWPSEVPITSERVCEMARATAAE